MPNLWIKPRLDQERSSLRRDSHIGFGHLFSVAVKRSAISHIGVLGLRIASRFMLLGLVHCASLGPTGGEGASESVTAVDKVGAAEKMAPAFQADRLRADLTYLSSEGLKGRGLGTPELDLAAEYLQREFEKAGLSGALADGTYLQSFDISTEITLGVKNSVQFTTGKTIKTLELGTDYQPLGFSDSRDVGGTLLFAGYGISAPELGYDDYDGLEVKGKIVVALRGLPGGAATGVFGAPGSERYGQLRYKALNAREKGAGAIIFIDREHGGRLLPLPKGQVISEAGIVAIHAERAALETYLIGAGYNLAMGQQKIDASQKSASQVINKTACQLSVALVRNRGQAKNVVAKLEGNDPELRLETIVIGAHYDHLGLGGESSLAPDRYGQIHFGADDNASGTAGVLELARYFAAKGRQARTLHFVLFSAEEAGLGGSSHYVSQPVHVLDATIAMINLDMVGRMVDRKVFVQGVDTADGFRDLLTRLASEQHLVAQFTGDGYGPSDHTPFYARKVPVLFFFTGAHADYHRPSDTVEKINIDGEIEVLSLIKNVVEALSATTRRPPYIQLSSAPALQVGGGNERGGYGAYLGTIPDFTEGEGGVKLTGVRAGSPAEKAGLQAGDMIVELGGQAIRNLHDYTYALKSHKAGETVEIGIVRSGVIQVVKAKLGVRP